jgi:hypothetical protein
MEKSNEEQHVAELQQSSFFNNFLNEWMRKSRFWEKLRGEISGGAGAGSGFGGSGGGGEGAGQNNGDGGRTAQRAIRRMAAGAAKETRRNRAPNSPTCAYRIAIPIRWVFHLQ